MVKKEEKSRRTSFLSITLSPEENARIEAAAEDNHRYKSDWARSVILAKLDEIDSEAKRARR